MARKSVIANSVQTVSPVHPTLDEQVHIRLHDHVQRLRLILPVISVAVIALRKQNADLDEDIASILHRHASDPLDAAITTIEVLLDALNAQRASGSRPPKASWVEASDPGPFDVCSRKASLTARAPQVHKE